MKKIIVNALILGLLAIAGCGQKGDLFIPVEPAEEEAQQTSSS